MIPRVENRWCDASLLARASGDSRAVPHEQAAIFEENVRTANAVWIVRVRSTEQSRWYHRQPGTAPGSHFRRKCADEEYIYEDSLFNCTGQLRYR